MSRLGGLVSLDEFFNPLKNGYDLTSGNFGQLLGV
jgi:hypothetical protein